MRHILLHDISVQYGNHAALSHVSGAFNHGSLTAVAGANGAGKSTLLKAIMGEIPLTSGHIEHVNHTQKDIGYLPQAASIDRHFPLTVYDLVSLGTWRQSGAFKKISQQQQECIHQALEKVGLDGMQHRLMCELSSGQFQRVLFARLLLQDTPIILLDEPFAAIDEKTTQDLLKIILDWHKEERTVVAVLHDYEQIEAHFPHTLVLAQKEIYWGRSDLALSCLSPNRSQSTPLAHSVTPEARYDLI